MIKERNRLSLGLGFGQFTSSINSLLFEQFLNIVAYKLVTFPVSQTIFKQLHSVQLDLYTVTQFIWAINTWFFKNYYAGHVYRTKLLRLCLNRFWVWPRVCVYDKICKHGQPLEGLDMLPGEKYNTQQQCVFYTGNANFGVKACVSKITHTTHTQLLRNSLLHCQDVTWWTIDQMHTPNSCPPVDIVIQTISHLRLNNSWLFRYHFWEI